MKRDTCDISWKILREALAILSGENKKKWYQEYELDTAGYILLRMKVLSYLLKRIERPVIAGYKTKAIEEMSREVMVLLGVVSLFEAKLEKAKKENDTLFLNTVNHIFGDEASSFNLPRKKRGRIISEATLKKRIESVKKFLLTDVTLEKMGMQKTGTFYSRNKAAFLCHMAYVTYASLSNLPKSPEYEIERTKAMEEIKSLMLKYTILPCEISLPIKHDPVFCSIIKGEGLSDIDNHIKKLTTLKKLLSSHPSVSLD